MPSGPVAPAEALCMIPLRRLQVRKTGALMLPLAGREVSYVEDMPQFLFFPDCLHFHAISAGALQSQSFCIA